eukprot:1258410-Pleurochrysis_carterae.AAC.1
MSGEKDIRNNRSGTESEGAARGAEAFQARCESVLATHLGKLRIPSEALHSLSLTNARIQASHSNSLPCGTATVRLATGQPDAVTNVGKRPNLTFGVVRIIST